MNGITVTLNDKTKTASCRETVALCAKYALTVSPALEVDEEQTETVDGVLTSTVKGYLVLHRRFVGRTPPDGVVKFIGGQQVANQNYEWDLNEVYGYAELTTKQVNGKWVTEGLLDLRTMTLCRDFIQKYGADANAPLNFAVYDPVAGGLVGSGEFDVKVVEPYFVTQNQSLTLFKGDKGDNGVTPTIGTNGHWYFGDIDTGVTAIGQNGTTPTIGLNGHWYIGETDTGIVAQGQNGTDGSVCTIGADWYWYIDGAKTTVKAQGTNGSVCTIDPVTKHWLINGADTGVVAEGTKGDTVVLDGTYVYNEATSKWHQMHVFTDPDTGDKTVYVDEEGVDTRPELTKPTCSVSKSGGVATITCTDSNGTTTAQVSDGQDGEDGEDGEDATYSVNAIGSSASASLQNASVNTVTCSGTTLALTLPSALASGKMRDLVVLVTGPSSGSATVSVSGYTTLLSDDSHALSDAVSASAKVMFVFSEVSSGVFVVARKDLASL